MSSRRSKPPEPFVFFLDESLGTQVVAGLLRGAGERAEILTDHFPSGTADETWLGHCGRNGWLVLTKDQRIRYRKAERTALALAGARAFAVRGGNLTGAEIGSAILKAIPAIKHLARSRRSAFLATISAGGHVRLTWPL